MRREKGIWVNLTTLKKILLDRAIRGDIIRIFDVNGEFTMLTEKLGGTIIYLDGQSGNIINILQILPNDENQAIAFENHMSKVGVIYTYLKGGEVSENENPDSKTAFEGALHEVRDL